MIQEAEANNSASLALVWTQEGAPDAPDIPEAANDFGRHVNLAIVSKSWLEIMGQDLTPADGMTEIPFSESDPAARAFLKGQWPLLARADNLSIEQTPGVTPYDYKNSHPLPVPMLGGGSDLAFLKRTLVIVVDDVYPTFNDYNLSALVTTQNVIFTGVDATTALVSKYRLTKNWRVTRAAESGILAAQFATYFAWLRAISWVALLIALILATAVGAMISAAVHARHDFSLRIYGRTWPEILRVRILRETVIIFGVGLVIAGMQSGFGPWLVLLATALTLGIVSLAQIHAARWNFRQLTHRKV